MRNQWLLCTILEAEDEQIMRDYLLNPEKRWTLAREKYFIIRNIDELWPFFMDKKFFCVHFYFDPKKLIRTPHI